MQKTLSLAFLLWAFLSTTLSAAVDTLLLQSPKMQKTIKNVVITPENGTPDQRYPVLYLLHGYSDYYDGWVKKVPVIKELANQYQTIIVCPDGGFSSWYLDSPADSAYQYETYMINELIPAIDEKYKTLKQRESRAITGLSMGGHGALYLAIRHRDLFANAGSMSGGVDLTHSITSWDIAKRLGSYQGNEELWHKNSVITIARQLKNGELNLSFECGTDDFFIGINRMLHALLVEKKIAHDYTERPGAHNWNYWANAIKYQMLYFSGKFSYTQQ